MNECDGNQLLENMLATQTQNQIGDFFCGGNSAKQAKTSNLVKPMVKNNQLMEMLRNSNWVVQKPQFHWLCYDHANKNDDMQYLYTAKEN